MRWFSVHVRLQRLSTTNRESGWLQCELVATREERESVCLSLLSAAPKTGMCVGQAQVPRFTTQHAPAPGCATSVCVTCIHSCSLLRVCLSQACSRASCSIIKGSVGTWAQVQEALPGTVYEADHITMEGIPAHRVSTRATMR